MENISLCVVSLTPILGVPTNYQVLVNIALKEWNKICPQFTIYSSNRDIFTIYPFHHKWPYFLSNCSTNTWSVKAREYESFWPILKWIKNINIFHAFCLNYFGTYRDIFLIYILYSFYQLFFYWFLYFLFKLFFLMHWSYSLCNVCIKLFILFLVK